MLPLASKPCEGAETHCLNNTDWVYASKPNFACMGMPGPWTGEGLVDFFEADDFIALLEGSLQG